MATCKYVFVQAVEMIMYAKFINKLRLIGKLTPLLTTLIIILLTIAPQYTQAQKLYATDVAKAHQQIINLNYNKQASAAAPWISGYALFVDALTTTRKIDTDSIIQQLSEFIKQQKKFSSNNYTKLFISDLYLMKSYLHLISNSNLYASTSYFWAYQAINSVTDWQRDRFRLFQLAIDAQLQNIAPLLAENRTTEERLSLFRQILNDINTNSEVPPTFKDEVRLLSLILLPLVGDNGELAYTLCCEYGTEWIESSVTKSYISANCMQRALQHDRALATMLTASKKGENTHFNQVNLFIGCSLLNQLSDSCVIFLNKFISLQTNKANVEYAKLKLAWYYFINNNSDAAQQLVAEIVKQKPITANDKQAVYECRHSNTWNIDLLKARLMFDASKYEASQLLLNKISNQLFQLSPLQVNEYWYRLGRVCHLNGQYAKAKEAYAKAIDNNLATQLYYPCYAAYYLGCIYKLENNIAEANKYFNICIKTESPIYKSSITQKAKMALQ